MKKITLNPGSQQAFVNTDYRYSAYIGGIGSGKTFAGLVKGVKMAMQPRPDGSVYGPRGLVGAVTYPVLRDVVVPQFMEICEGTNMLSEFKIGEYKAIMSNGAEILFRSLDAPDRLRGLELSWFFIDEGRHTSRGAWDILVGRLRQREYSHAGWVSSTPNGYDWMWQLFNEESPHRLESAMWYGAPTMENQHLPPGYVEDLKLSYNGLWYEQEVMGRFVGLMAGAVFPHFNVVEHIGQVKYDPSQALYSFWDFGIGDLGVVLFAQMDFIEKEIAATKEVEYMPVLRFIDCLEGKDKSAAEWARDWKRWLDRNVGGRRPDMNIGDPAGRQRSAVTGTSVLDALGAEGVTVLPAPKKPQDYAMRILDNMMAADRVLVDQDKCARLGAAFSTHHFKTDDQGNRTSSTPVHDWTSHFCDAARYGATMLLSNYNARTSLPEGPKPGPGTLGYVLDNIKAYDTDEHWIGEGEKTLSWR